MADQAKELLEIPRDFVKEGTQFMNRCTKPDQREFIKYVLHAPSRDACVCLGDAD